MTKYGFLFLFSYARPVFLFSARVAIKLQFVALFFPKKRGRFSLHLPPFSPLFVHPLLSSSLPGCSASPPLLFLSSLDSRSIPHLFLSVSDKIKSPSSPPVEIVPFSALAAPRTVATLECHSTTPRQNAPLQGASCESDSPPTPHPHLHIPHPPPTAPRPGETL